MYRPAPPRTPPAGRVRCLRTPHGPPIRHDRRASRRLDRAPVAVLRRQRAAGRRRPRQRLAEGSDRLAARARADDGRLPGHLRQRGGDDRASPRERANRRDVVRVLGSAADPAPARPRRGAAARRRRASTQLLEQAAFEEPVDPRGAARDRARRGHADRRLLRLRRAAHGATRASARTARCRRASACAPAARRRSRTTSPSATRASIDGLAAVDPAAAGRARAVARSLAQADAIAGLQRRRLELAG